LGESQESLDRFSDDPNDITQLRFCQTLIHQVFGSLHMVGFYGASMIAEEMELLSQSILDNDVIDVNDALSILKQSIQALPDYLDRVQKSKSDYPGIILSLLNEMRAVRKASLVTEATLFSPNLQAAYTSNDVAHPITQDDARLRELIAKLRQMYQYAVSSLVRGGDFEKNISYLIKASDRLEKLLQGTKRHAVWEIARAFFIGLKNDNKVRNVAAKRLFSALDFEISILAKLGSKALLYKTSEDALKSLLYYVGESDSDAPDVVAIKNKYKLDRFLPKAFVDNTKESFVEIDQETLDVIHSALHNEFRHIKSKLDHCLQDDHLPIEINFIQSALQRINDTLAMLGVGKLRQRINKIANEIQAIKIQEDTVASERLLGIIKALSNAEELLGHSLSMVLETDDENTLTFDQKQDEYLSEARNALENSKDAIVNYIVSEWNVEKIATVPDDLREARNCLSQLELNRAMNILSGCVVYIQNKLIQEGLKPQWQQLDSLADVIASIDYYLEFLSTNGENDETILDKADKALSDLGVSSARVESFSDAKKRREERNHAVDQTASLMHSLEEPTATTEEPESDLIDEEVIGIFCEEAAEIQTTLAEFFPQWADNFSNEPALTETRRAFHTLKGSGRMVKANDIGELAWSVENMLNRIIDKTISPNQLHIKLIDKVRTMLPEMVEAFSQQQANPYENTTQQCMTLGHQLSRNEDASELAEILFPAAPSNASYDTDENENEDDAPVNTEPDLQLWEIFVGEARSHLAVAQEFVDHIDKVQPFYEPPSDAVQRALHTIKGSAYMAELNIIGDLIAPLERFAKELRSYQVSIDDDIFQLIQDGKNYTEDALAQISDGQYPVIEKFDQFLARVHELRERTLGPLIRQKEAEDGQIIVDPAMLEMLMAEEMNLLLDADLMIEQWQKTPASIDDWQPVYDELVVFKEGSEKANQQTMASLCDALAACYKQLIEGNIDADESTYSALLNGHISLMDCCDALAAGLDLPEEDPQIIEALRKSAIVKAAATETMTAVEADVSEPLTALTQDAPIDQPYTGSDLHDDDDIDEETIEIFYEEAQELLEEIDTEIHSWEDGGEAREHNESIQRILHTFKGGARLAGLMEMGDTAHDFESYLIEHIAADAQAETVVKAHAYQDKLIAQVDRIGAQHGLAQIAKAETEPHVATSTPPTQDISDAINEPVIDRTQDESTPNIVSFPEPTDTIEPNDGELVEPVPAKALSMPFNAVTNQTDTPASGKAQPQEMVKVSADLMESLVNLAGETSINRGRVEEQVNDLGFSLDEMGSTVHRLQEQLRRLDIETEAQMIFRQEQLSDAEDFDPLEMDRYTHLQQLSRSLIESASDLVDLRSTLSDKTRDVETVLLEQSRINTELQEGLMRSRMVPFSRIVPRLRRIVRQISTELGKDVKLELGNTEGDLDKSMMERMVPPLEHMLRNAIDHGIESAEMREQAGKPNRGRIYINLARDGADVLIHIEDDGGGIDIDRVRNKAIERYLMNADAVLSDQEVLQFILYAGFSTAETVTQISGRGVGMDVVNSEIKQMGGSIVINSEAGKGASFTVRVPFTVSVNRALMVNIGEDRYAIPLNTIEGIVRISPFELEHYYANPEESFEYAGQDYDLRYLGSLLDDKTAPRLHGHTMPLPVLLLRSAEHSVAIHVDSLQGSREIVVKSLGPQFKAVQGVSGAAILGDGNVVIILDPNAMVRRLFALDAPKLPKASMEAQLSVARDPLVMVVDDSVTVRKVTSRLLEREGYEVVLAKDGMDAMTKLQDVSPDIMLLDIEMPRMDGFEVAKNVRSSIDHNQLPIIMITSRTSDKHRQRGLESGANLYMGKPYQEAQLLSSIKELITQPEAKNAPFCQTLVQQHHFRQIIESCDLLLEKSLLIDQVIKHLGQLDSFQLDVDIWLVDVDSSKLEDLPEWTSFEKWLASADKPIIFGEGNTFDAGSERFTAWCRQFKTKLLSISGQLNTIEHYQKAEHLWVLAASTGGPEAIKLFLDHLPTGLGIGFLYVQHIEERQHQSLVDTISRNSGYSSQLATHGDMVSADSVTLMPVSQEVKILPGGMIISAGQPWRGAYQPSIDQVVANIAMIAGKSAGVIFFSGLGDDGVDGARLMSRQGGKVWIQSPASCACDVMPQAIDQTGIVSTIGTPEQLAEFMVAEVDGQATERLIKI